MWFQSMMDMTTKEWYERRWIAAVISVENNRIQTVTRTRLSILPMVGMMRDFLSLLFEFAFQGQLDYHQPPWLLAGYLRLCLLTVHMAMCVDICMYSSRNRDYLSIFFLQQRCSSNQSFGESFIHGQDFYLSSLYK